MFLLSAKAFPALRVASVLAALTALAGTVSPAVAQDTAGPYVRLYGGLSSVEGMLSADPSTADLDLDGGSGLTFGGAAGYAFDNGFRTEIDLSLSEADFDGTFTENIQVFVPCGEISGSPCLDGRVDGEYEGLSAMAMAYYDFSTGSALTPYVGIGLGLIDTELEATTSGTLNAGSTSDFVLLDGSDTELAYRVAAGLSYDLGAVDLTADYSWTRTGRLSLDGQGAFTTFGFNNRVNVHSFTLGVRYAF
jgi:opacity protein-like surface antigen